MVGIGLIEPTESPDLFNYKSLFKFYILQTIAFYILHVFLLFIFVWNKIHFSKN